MAVSTEARIGTELAGYRLEALLGRGGASVVYRAEDLRLRRKVALKLLTPELAEDRQFRERFLRESELAASLDHSNIVPVYDAGEAEGLLYIAMRYVDGSDLSALLQQAGNLEPAHALALVAQVGDALDVAHERGLVHRDVKPSNVLITGRPGKEHCYLADFGLTKRATDGSGPTDSGQMVGTVDYVAPEQIRGERIDRRADVYSLTCLLYQCLTGMVPFKRDSDIAVIYAHLSDAPPRVSALLPQLPSAVDQVLSRGMAKQSDERWDTCGALIAAAQTALGETLPARGPVVRARRSPRWLLMWGVVAMLAVSGALSYSFLRGGGTSIARADSLIRIDPARAKAIAGVRVPGLPSSVTVCAAIVFVASRDGTVALVDPKTSTVYPVHIDGTPVDVSHVGNLAAVLSGPPKDTVTLVDTTFGGINWVRSLPGEPSAAPTSASDGTSFWIVNPNAQALERLDPAYGRIVMSIPLPRPGARGDRNASYNGVAAGQGPVWVTGNETEHVLWRVDPPSRHVKAIRLPFAPGQVAVGGDGVWVVDSRGGTVVRVDPQTNRLTSSIRVGREPAGISAGAGAIWVANELDGTVSRIDPERMVVSETIRVGGRPIDVAVGLGAVWVVKLPS